MAVLATAAVVCTSLTQAVAQDAPDDLQRREQERQIRILQQQMRGNLIIGGNPAATDAEAKNTSVFVRDSAVAAEKLALAERMERLKEWDTSAEVYQEVLDQYADRVLPIHSDDKGQPDRFGSVTSVVQDRLAAWPEEGRSVYLARYELPARRLLESADTSTRSDLMKVVNRYFLTEAGRDAALMLIESYFDHAEFIAAAMLSDRLVEKHPQVSDHAPLLLTRSALSWHLAGEAERAKGRAAQLSERFADASDTIGGKSRNLREIVQSALASPRHVQASSPGGWPVPFGSNDHTAIATETVNRGRIWAKLASIPIRPVTRANNALNEFEMENQPTFHRQRDYGAATGVLPVIDGSQLFFQDNSGIYGYDLERGEPLAGWLASNAKDGGKFVYPNAASMPRGVQMTTTLTDRHVLAILGQTEPFNFGGVDSQTAVVCLDRATGRQLWTASLNAVASEDEALRTARPVGSVLVAGDSVFVMARNRRPGAFEDSYLCCFALEDGSLRWTRHLASGNASRAYFDYNLPPQTTGDSHLAYADGNIFLSTDMGALASVNAADGTLSWLSVYPRLLPQAGQVQWAGMNAGAMPRVVPAYVGNPVIVDNGLIISLPGDAQHLFVHDSLTGEFRGSVRMLREPADAAGGDQSEEFEVLVGILNGRIVVAGSRSVALLDLAKITGERSFADVLVRHQPFVRSENREDTIRGRPFLTDNSIYVPTAWKLYRLAADGSRALEMYPPSPQDTLDGRTDERPGNIVFSNDSLIVAGPDGVNVYADLSLLRKRMETAVAADARSIHPRLRYADALFNAGQTEESLRWIDSSIQQLTSNGFVSPGPDRDRIFDQVAEMFRRLSGQERTETTLGSLLERLQRTADTPLQQVSLHLARAYFAKRTRDFATAADAYQKLIEEPSTGAVRLRTSESTTTASDYAIAQIDGLLKQYGRPVYERVEARAAAALAAAQATNDASKLLSVLSLFPNSQAGQEAIQHAIKASHSRGSGSIELLRRVGSMPGDPAEKLPLYRALLAAELERGDLHSALGRARQLARLDANASLGSLPALSGQSLSAATPAQLVEALQSMAFAAEDRTLPDLKLPDAEPLFDLKNPVVVKGVRNLLVPSNPRRDRVIALGSDRKSIRLFEPGAVQPTKVIDTPEIEELALSTWHGDSLAVVASSQLLVLDTNAGGVQWSFDPQDLKSTSRETVMMSIDDNGLISPTPPAKRQAIVMNPTARRAGLVIARQNRAQVIRQLGDVGVAGWEADEVPQWQRETIAFARFVGDACVVMTSRGRVIGLDAKTGKVRWQSSFSDRPATMFGVYDNLLVLGGNTESESNLIVYRADDGSQLLSQSYSGSSNRRLNTLSISKEGYLAAVHNDFINLFDLGSGDPSPLATFDGQGQNTFEGTRSQDQVQFCADKLLVLVNGERAQQVRMFDALTLEPTKVTDAKTKQQVERQLMPIYRDGIRQGESARMYVHKDRLLLRAGRDFMVYRVPVPDATPWQRHGDPLPTRMAMSSQSPLFVQGGILLFDWPEKQVGQPISSPRVQFYQRDVHEGGRETGTLLDEFNLSRQNAKMLDHVQPVDGGIYTVWSDGSLAFYPSRKPS